MSKKKRDEVQLALFEPFTFIHVDKSFDAASTQLIEKAINFSAQDCVRSGAYHPSTIFTHFAVPKPTSGRYDTWTLGNNILTVTPKRLRAFQSNMKCVSCGCEGTLFLAERHVNDNCGQYLNLYALSSGGQLILMTVDHILPDSMGGLYHPTNFQTMCRPCNMRKGNDMTTEDVENVLKDIGNYAKTWVDHGFLRELLQLQLLVAKEADRFKYQQLKQILDRNRKHLSHATKRAKYQQLTSSMKAAIAKIYEVPPPPPSKLSQGIKCVVGWFRSVFDGSVDNATV